MVYADHLQAQGDPRGELISLQRTGKHDEAAAMIERHAEHFYGPLAPYRRPMDGSDDDVFSWRRGFIHQARIGYDTNVVSDDSLSIDAALTALLTHPSGALLEALTVPINMLDDGCYFEPVVKAIADAGAPALRRLRLGEFRYAGPRGPTNSDYDYEISWTHFPDMKGLWPRLPRLESLTLQGCLGDYAGPGQLGPIHLPRLKHLQVISGGVREDNVRALTEAQWPALEHFELWPGDINYGFSGGVDDVLPLLEGRRVPLLRHLGLVNASYTDELIEPLAKSPLLPRLTQLNLALGTLSDEGAKLLVKHRDKFAHLQQLDLEENFLTEVGVRLVADLCGSVLTSEQKEPRDWAAEGEDGRYVSVGE